MALCKWCEQEMMDSATVSCTGNTHVRIGDELYESVPFQEDENDDDDEPDSSGLRCHDCGVKAGGFHHPGCDMERCPVCGDQLISCECLDEEE